MTELIERLAAAAGAVRSPAYPDRVASKVGERIEFVDLEQVTHFFAADKLTFAATAAKNYAVDYTHPGAGAKAGSGQIRARASRHAGQCGARPGTARLVRRRG